MMLLAATSLDSCYSPSTLPPPPPPSCCVLLLPRVTRARSRGGTACSLLPVRRGRGQHHHSCSSWWNGHESSSQTRISSLSYPHSDGSSYRLGATPDHMDELSSGPPECRCHPFEEIAQPLHLNDGEVARLSDAETARTIVEVNNKATLMISGFVDNAVHERIILSDLPYITDENGDIYFEVGNDEGLLESIIDNERIVQVMIGLNNTETFAEMELSTSSVSDFGPGEISDEESDLDDDYGEDEVFIIEEEEDDDVSSETLSGWSNLETMNSCHPMYFATTVAEAVSNANIDWLDQPSTSLFAEGHLRPAFFEESTMAARRSSSEAEKNIKESGAAFFKLEAMNIHLITAYGNQPTVKVEEFRTARPDIIAHSAANIISRLRLGGDKITQALKSLCWRCKAIQVEEAAVIGVDSLGFDLRVCSGTQVQTMRFAFHTQATSEFSAEKQLHELLFPRLHQEGQLPQAHQKES